MILGLDIGDARIGVAIANPVAKLPRPLQVLPNNDAVYETIVALAKSEQVGKIVVGLPRNMDGLETAQSQKARQFATVLAEKTDIEIVFADETLSSVRAEDMTPPKGRAPGAPLDDVAACFILEEFLHSEAK